jgi:hypothetical protein
MRAEAVAFEAALESVSEEALDDNISDVEAGLIKASEIAI